MEKLRIGITGHRNISEEDIDELSSLLNDEIKMLQETNPDRQMQMLNALAAGADRLAASCAIRKGIELVAVLPFPAEQYEKDFEGEDIEKYRMQLRKASEIIIPAEDKNMYQQNKEAGYRAAGRHIADNCDYLIAFWDGTPGTDDGCGTADIVKYFTDRHPDKLIHIKTGRQDKRCLTEIKDEADNRSLHNQKAYMNYYSGNNKPYIYVSFSEANEEQVMPLLEKLSGEKVLFWHGEKATKRELKRVEGAHAVLLFVTQNYLKDENFRKVVDEAVRCNKNILTIYLENVQMDSWGHMQLDSAQALFIGRFPDEEAFTARLKEAEIFRNMQVTEQQKRFKRNTTLTAVFTPLIAAAIVFAFIVYPRFFVAEEQPEEIIVEQKENAIFKGLTQEELDKIEFLTILGNKIYTKSDTGLQIFDNGDGTERYMIDFEDGTHDEGILERGSISDFEDIKQLRNVHFLKVLYNDIANIEDIAEIKDIISLELTGNPISDLTGVEKLENLEFIRIDHTNVKDLSPLHKTNLKGISMKFTGVTEIDPDFARQLSEFQCEGCNITEIPKLGPYEHALLDIHRLNLKSNDASFLEDVKSFDIFNVDGFSAETLKPYLQGKPVYKMLAVASMNPTSLKEIDFLNMMPGSELGLDNSDRLLSLEGAEHFEGIESICLQHCEQLEDFTPLLKIKSLRHVAVSPPMLEKAERDLGGSDIEIEVRDVW